MKISHKELEVCRLRPRSWVQSQQSASGPRKFGYSQAVGNSIRKFHKTGDADTARAHLQDLIDRHFTNQSRIALIEGWLEDYISWCELSGVVVADSYIRVSLQSGGLLELGGLVSRLDVTATGYCAVLLGVAAAGWSSELRMPLIQRAVSVKYARPLREVQVGVQKLDGSDLQVRSYSTREIEAAVTEFRKISASVQRLVGGVTAGR